MSEKEFVMLVLSRTKLESIVINDNIVVTVVSCVGGKVKLGVEAPADVKVHRKEIYDLIRKEKESQ
jgi:carbon storage regulator